MSERLRIRDVLFGWDLAERHDRLIYRINGAAGVLMLCAGVEHADPFIGLVGLFGFLIANQFLRSCEWWRAQAWRNLDRAIEALGLDDEDADRKAAS